MREIARWKIVVFVMSDPGADPGAEAVETGNSGTRMVIVMT